MSYQNELLGYQKHAEAYYDEYAGGFEGMDPGYDNYHASTLGRINPADRTYTVRVQSTASRSQEVIVFGGYENADQPAGVTVSVGESSHAELRAESKSQPFLINGMKMFVSDPEQIGQVLKIHHRRSTGAYAGWTYQPADAVSPQNHNPKMIDDGNFEMEVTGHDSLRFQILPGASVTFVFTVRVRASMGNLLQGRNVAEVSHSPRITGLPQIDMVRMPAPRILGATQPPRPEPRPLPPTAERPPVRSHPPRYTLRKSEHR